MCEAAGRDVHLNVEVRVEGQDSPYQVAAPCWLAELTLNVNLLTMRTMMMKMMKMMMRKMRRRRGGRGGDGPCRDNEQTWKSIHRSCNHRHDCRRFHLPTRRWHPCTEQITEVFNRKRTFLPFPLSPPSQEPSWQVYRALLPSPHRRWVPRTRRKYPPREFLFNHRAAFLPCPKRATGHGLLKCQISAHQASFANI